MKERKRALQSYHFLVVRVYHFKYQKQTDTQRILRSRTTERKSEWLGWGPIPYVVLVT